MGKILLFYKYVTIEYPKRVLKWQQQICQNLELTGRIIIGQEGINGTVGGLTESTDRYKEIMQKNPLFADVDFKESPGDASCFPKLSVKIRDEVVSLGVDPKEISAKDTGTHLNPDQVHNLLQNKPDDLIVLDARNEFEWKIGKFKDAITPKLQNFRDFPDYINDNLDQFKDKQVLMYCTGGIRCERATAYLKSKNVAAKVMQVEGGIHRYAEAYPDGFFRGKNYVFDNRVAVRINDDVLSNCLHCNEPSDDYSNCINGNCNKHFLACKPCLEKLDYACCTECQELVVQCKVKKRPEFYQFTG